MSEHASLCEICRDDMNTEHGPFDRDVKWRSPVQAHSTPVQVKEPYIVNLNGHFKNTGVYNVHLR